MKIIVAGKIIGRRASKAWRNDYCISCGIHERERRKKSLRRIIKNKERARRAFKIKKRSWKKTERIIKCRAGIKEKRIRRKKIIRRLIKIHKRNEN